MDIDKILKVIEDNAIEMVRFEQTEFNGIPIGRDIPTRLFRKRVEDGVYMPLLNLTGNLGIFKGKKLYIHVITFIAR